MDSLREDLAAAGIPNRREISASLVYRFQPILSSKAELIGESMEIDSMDIDTLEIHKSREPETFIPKCPRYDYESDHTTEPVPPLQRQYNPSDTPLIKVSQQIEEYEPHLTATSDASYPDDGDNGDDEGFSAFEESIIIPDPPTSHMNPVSPQPPQRNKPPTRHSLGFGDDELLAEQVGLATSLVIKVY